jgi:hypothetical protein
MDTKTKTKTQTTMKTLEELVQAQLQQEEAQAQASVAKRQPMSKDILLGYNEVPRRDGTGTVNIGYTYTGVSGVIQGPVPKKFPARCFVEHVTREDGTTIDVIRPVVTANRTLNKLADGWLSGF